VGKSPSHIARTRGPQPTDGLANFSPTRSATDWPALEIGLLHAWRPTSRPRPPTSASIPVPGSSGPCEAVVNGMQMRPPRQPLVGRVRATRGCPSGYPSFRPCLHRASAVGFRAQLARRCTALAFIGSPTVSSASQASSQRQRDPMQPQNPNVKASDRQGQGTCRSKQRLVRYLVSTGTFQSSWNCLYIAWIYH
jgi:hypothetical protein